MDQRSAIRHQRKPRRPFASEKLGVLVPARKDTNSARWACPIRSGLRAAARKPAAEGGAERADLPGLRAGQVCALAVAARRPGLRASPAGPEVREWVATRSSAPRAGFELVRLFGLACSSSRPPGLPCLPDWLPWLACPSAGRGGKLCLGRTPIPPAAMGWLACPSLPARRSGRACLPWPVPYPGRRHLSRSARHVSAMPFAVTPFATL